MPLFLPRSVAHHMRMFFVAWTTKELPSPIHVPASTTKSTAIRGNRMTTRIYEYLRICPGNLRLIILDA